MTETFYQSSPLILLIFLIIGFAFTLYKIGQLQQQIENERVRFETEMIREQTECDKKITLLELKIQTLTQQIIDILKGHNLPTISIESGRDSSVDIDGVGNAGNNRSRPDVIRRGL